MAESLFDGEDLLGGLRLEGTLLGDLDLAPLLASHQNQQGILDQLRRGTVSYLDYETGGTFTVDGVDAVRRLVGERATAVAASDHPHNLPGERDVFIGRERDLAELTERLEGGPLVSVLGIGGTGKTRMVIRAGWTWLSAFPGGVWFCDLSEARGVDGIVSAVARALDVPLGKGDPVVQLGHAIAGRGRCLVLLDNFEQVARHATETLAPWLDRASEAQFVVTTREMLGLPGEQALVLAPLSSVDGVALTSSGGRRDRQATLRATMDWSWDLLSTDEQSALVQLSVFEGGFTLDAAEEVLALDEAWPMDAVQALVDKSLVRQVSDERFDLLVSVQEYAAEKLDAVGDGSRAEARHGAHFATYGTEEAREALDRHGGVELRWAMARELDNLVAASRRAVIACAGAVAAATALAAGEVLLVTGPFAAAATVLDAARGVATDAVDEVWVTTLLARVLRPAGRMDEARLHYDAALAVAREVGNRRLESVVLTNLGWLHQQQCRMDEARAHYDAALAVAREVGYRQLECAARTNLGSLHLQQGRMDEARTHYDAALAVAREVGNRQAEGLVLLNLGIVHRQQGRMDEARAYIDTALGVAREVGDRVSEGNLIGNLGVMHFHQGRMDEARAHYDAALAVAREVGDRVSEGNLVGNLGLVYMRQGRMDEARAHYETALAVAREVGHRRSEGYVLGSLGFLLLQQGHLTEAQACVQRGERLMRELDDPNYLGLVLCVRAHVEHSQGYLQAARATLAEVESLATTVGAGVDTDLGQRLAEARIAVEGP